MFIYWKVNEHSYLVKGARIGLAKKILIIEKGNARKRTKGRDKKRPPEGGLKVIMRQAFLFYALFD